MGDKAKAYVLTCGCRFFGGNASMCDLHRFERKQARRDGAIALFLMACAMGFFGAMMFCGCAVDSGGLGGDDATAMDGKVRGADSGIVSVDSGGNVADVLPQDVSTVEPDVGAGDASVDIPPLIDGIPDMATGVCPKSPPIEGCALGTLSYPDGPVACCVPVDWEGYRVHCPQPVPGCRWKTGSFDGWTGECCA